MTWTNRARFDLSQSANEEDWLQRVIRVLEIANLSDYRQVAGGISGNIRQARTSLQFRIHPHVVESEDSGLVENEDSGFVQEPPQEAVLIDACTLVMECQLSYRLFSDTLADVDTVWERVSNALSREQMISDLGTKRFSIDISALPELGGFFALLQTTSFTARVRGGGAEMVLDDRRLDFEGELDSTTRKVIRDAILFGF